MVSKSEKRKSAFSWNNAGFVLALFFLIFLQFYSIHHLEKKSSQKLRLDIAPPYSLTHLTFGYSEILADLFWVRAIQDFDYCDSPQGKAAAGYVLCASNSWLFKLLDVTTDLSPQFRVPLATGGLALSVLISDIEGATKIFNKAVVAFPNDWPILYRAAYHAMIEEGKKRKAGNLLTMAAHNGAPPWVYSLAGKMYLEDGSEEMAVQLLKEFDGDEANQAIADRLRAKIEKFKKEKQVKK